MSGFLDRFRRGVISSIWKDEVDNSRLKEINDKIALGVLLWVVAEADSKFLPQEEAEIKQVLKKQCRITEEDLRVVLVSIQEAARERIDLYTFTSEVSQDLPHDIKVSILKDLFRVACVDNELDNNELGVIRKIAGLFHISHKEFINAKVDIKKEFGIAASAF